MTAEQLCTESSLPEQAQIAPMPDTFRFPITDTSPDLAEHHLQGDHNLHYDSDTRHELLQ